MNNYEGNSGLINSNEQLRLLNQLLERKIFHLQNENQGLRERIRALTTEEDKSRLKLLLADKERRRLAKLKAIINKDVTIFQNRVRELNAFIDEIDQGMDELVEKHGALNPNVADGLIPPGLRPPRVTAEFNIQLMPIAESPLVVPLMEENRIRPVKQENETQNGEEQLRKSSVGNDCRQSNSRNKTASPIRNDDLVSETPAARTSINFNGKKSVGAFAKDNQSELVATTESTELDFEDALSYTLVPNAQQKRRSTLNSDQGSSFLTVAQMRPLYTSTPKNVVSRVSAVPSNVQTVKSSVKVTTQRPDNDEFVPPVTCEGRTHRKKPARKRKDSEVNATQSHSEGDSGFIFKPQATVNVTARRATSVVSNDTINRSAIVADDDVAVGQGDVVPEVNKEKTRKRSSTDCDESTFVVPSKPQRRLNGKMEVKTSATSIQTRSSMSRETPSPTSSTLVSNVSEYGRQKRAAAIKVNTYKLPNLHKKLRRQ